MNNDLKNFLDGEYKKKHDTHLVNFVLDLVEKEVEKKTIVWADTLQGYIKIVPKHDISTIVNNLKN